MENDRADLKTPRDERSITKGKRGPERVRREERRLRDALEDDDVCEALKRLHEPARGQQDEQEQARLPKSVRG